MTSYPPSSALSAVADRVGRFSAWLDRWRLVLLAIVAAGQAAVLVSMVVDSERLLISGREITVDVRPVDPRSLFRGDYVILTYDFSRLRQSEFDTPPRRGDRVYVTLAEKDGRWTPLAASGRWPSANVAGTVVLTGRVRQAATFSAPASLVTISYGLESFFVREGSGRAIEREIAPGKVKAHLVVARDGRSAIKALSVDGRRIETEPLF